MGNLLYTIAVILIIIWLIGFFGYAMGGVIHVLLAVALFAVVIGLINGAGRGRGSDPV